MNESTQEPKGDLKDAGLIISKFWMDLIDLKRGVDKYATIEEIKNKKSMNGANAWMLMCSIMIASIGLNQNSQAVIIGAMLISPLMSPILGIGLSVGINDRDLLKNSLQHFAVAILIAIVTSTIYFYLSPFDDMTTEINARTQPTFLDVLIAIFGGIAGIVSIARKDISTTLPGVAIATALMPPLCVCGYGIANGNWVCALNSFYLFFLNTVFVSLATYLIVRYLRFPYRKFVDPKIKSRNTLAVGFFALLILAPSIWIFSNIYKEHIQSRHVKDFIDDYIGEDKIFLDSYQYINSVPKDKLILKVYGSKINADNLNFYKNGLKKHDLANTELDILSTSEIKLEKLAELESKISNVEFMANNINVTNQLKTSQEKLIDSLKNIIDQNDSNQLLLNKLSKELQILYPDISELAISYSYVCIQNEAPKWVPVLALEWNRNVSNSVRTSHEEQIISFIKERASMNDIKIIRY